MKKLLLNALTLLSVASTHAQQWGDYTLYSAQNSNTAYLIDTMDTPNTIHSWTFPSSSKTGYSSYLLPGGYILRTIAKTGNSFTGGPICGEVQKADWNGNVVWDYVYSNADSCTHHDIKPMPNGNVLLISYERKSATDVSNAGGNNSIEMWPDKIVEIQPVGTSGGNIVWEWHAWDHMCQNVNSAKANFVTSISAHPELLNINNLQAKDWLHVNGVDYNAQLNQIVISSHAWSEIFVIDHSTTTAEAASHSGGNSGKGGDILYRWGNPQNYGGGTAANQVFNIVHDAHWVPVGCPKAGYLVGFNNNGQSNPSSYVDLINSPVNGYTYTLSGSAYSPANYSWRHIGLGHTSNMGGSQQLPNGNMLITIALAGLVYEIDSNQNVLWQKTFSGSMGAPAGAKAFRYSACYISGTPPTTPTITKSSDTLLASGSATRYIWYYNGSMISGATSSKYKATQNGAYVVKAVDSFGCASSLSTAFNFTSGINNISVEEMNITYPNPTNGILKIDAAKLNYNFEVTLVDNFGKEIKREKNVNTIDLSNFENGIYHIIFQTEGKTEHQQITLVK
jgi:hypothetical protein